MANITIRSFLSGFCRRIPLSYEDFLAIRSEMHKGPLAVLVTVDEDLDRWMREAPPAPTGCGFPMSLLPGKDAGWVAARCTRDLVLRTIEPEGYKRTRPYQPDSLYTIPAGKHFWLQDESVHGKAGLYVLRLLLPEGEVFCEANAAAVSPFLRVITLF